MSMRFGFPELRGIPKEVFMLSTLLGCLVGEVCRNVFANAQCLWSCGLFSVDRGCSMS
jgi:hypothetical protein